MKTIRVKLCVLLMVMIFIVFPHGQSAATWEENIDRPGMDYRNFDLASPDARLCQRECAAMRDCVAWTYVRPGVQGPRARCWLKSGAPAQVRNTNTISGIMRSASSFQAVFFIDETLTMTPTEARDGERVTFTFRVNNVTTHTFTRVQIRVLQPADSRGGGRVFKDVGNQVINPGINTYTVEGIFHRPSAGRGGIIINLLDRTGTYLPAPDITSSAYRGFILTPNNTYKLEGYVPLI